MFDQRTFSRHTLRIRNDLTNSTLSGAMWSGYSTNLIQAYEQHPEALKFLVNQPTAVIWRSVMGRAVCLIVRHLHQLDWVCYVSVPHSHPRYAELETKLTKFLGQNPEQSKASRNEVIKAHYSEMKFIHKDKVSRYGYISQIEQADIQTYVDKNVLCDYDCYEGLGLDKGYMWFMFIAVPEAGLPAFTGTKLIRQPLEPSTAIKLVDDIAYDFYKSHPGRKVPSDAAYRLAYLSNSKRFLKSK